MAVPTIIPSNAALAAAAARNTINIDTVGQIPKELYAISPSIYEKNMDATPFTILLRELGSEEAWNDTYNWYEDVLVPQRSTLDGSCPLGEDGGAGTITVANVSLYSVWDVVYIHAATASLLVTSITGSVLTGTWIVAPTAAIASGSTVVRIGNAREQVSAAAAGPTTRETQLYNYFQDMRHPVAASMMNIHGRYRTRPGDWEYQQSKKLAEHQIEKEKTLIFGQRSLMNTGTTGGSPLGTMQGLYHWITTNVTAVGGVLTRATFDTFLRGVMQANTHPGQDWWFMCSSRIASQISGWFSALERSTSEQTLFGTRVTVYRAPVHKDVKIVVHPIFDSEGFDDLGILFNMGERDAFKYIYHSIFDTKKHQVNVLASLGMSAAQIFYWTIFTLKVAGQEINCGVIEDVQETT